MVVCFSGAKIEAIAQRVGQIVGPLKEGSILHTHGLTMQREREGATAIGRKYKQLVRGAKQTGIEQIIMSGILPVMGYSRDIKTAGGWQLTGGGS